MSERPNDPSSKDDLGPRPPDDTAPSEALVPDDVDATEAFAADDPRVGGIENDELTLQNDEPTIEEGDEALFAAAEEAPLSSVAAIGGVEEADEQTRPMRPSERRAMRAAMERGQVAVDPAHRVSDRASAYFVIVTVGVFILIMFNGLLLGHGGFLTSIPTASPLPSVTASPLPSVTAVPSGSAAASPTPVPSTSPAPTPTVTPAPSPTPGPS